MLIHQFLENSARQFPNKPAVWYKKNWMTYSEIDAHANRVAAFLIESGVQKGDRVAIVFENSFEYIISYYGILKVGAVTVELNTDILESDLLFLLRHSESTGVILQNKYLPRLEAVCPQLPDLKIVISEKPGRDIHLPAGVIRSDLKSIFSSSAADPPGLRMIDVDLASIVYTSGSTGTPKGAMLTHLNIVANTRSIVEYLHLTHDDRIMVILPFFYVYGKSLLNTHVAVGGSLVIDNRFAFWNEVLKTMRETECTGFAGVPSTFNFLLHKSSLKKMSFPHLRYVTQAGGSMAPNVQKEVAMVFYPAKLYIMYGATEASARLSYLEPSDLPLHWGSIGKAIPNVELFVADQEGKPLPPETEGEIVARGANIMQGYWKDEEETKRVLRHGLYFTGDIGKMDRDGFLYVVGRSKDMIKAGANRVSAKEIEEKLMEHEAIMEVAVTGVPDEILGEAIKAFVVKKNNGLVLDEADILAYCKNVLPSFKVPKYIEFRDSLPKTPSGKIRKTELT